MTTTYGVMLTTIDDEAKAREIAKAALSSRLAACVQIFPVVSHYFWQETMREEKEYSLQMKIRARDYDALSALIRSLHTYEVPEMLLLEIAAGDAAYLDWIEKSARG
jgi:periplasmic divalent cation tolerance protein